MEKYKETIGYKLSLYLSECPSWVIERGINAIRKALGPDDIYLIKQDYENDPETWWTTHHHGWGTGIRNYLRKHVCLDNVLPTGNWDDYYIQIIELALGLR